MRWGHSCLPTPAVYLGGLGYWEEPELSLQYVRNRWLNNATGTWLSVDSVATEPRYLYVGNSPTTATDPSGLESLWDDLEGGVEREYHRAVHAFNRTVAEVEHVGEDALFASFKYFLKCAGVSDAAANNIVAHIRRLGGDTVHLLNVIGHAIQSGICELKATYRSAVKRLPLWMQKLAPSPGFDALLEYAAGVAVAAIEATLYQIVPAIILKFVPFAGIAMAIFRIFSFVQELIRTGSLIQTFLSQIDGNIPEMIHQVQMHHGIYSNYQRGFITGSILASIVAGVLTILSFKDGLSKLGGRLAHAVKDEFENGIIEILHNLAQNPKEAVEIIAEKMHEWNRMKHPEGTPEDPRKANTEHHKQEAEKRNSFIVDIYLEATYQVKLYYCLLHPSAFVHIPDSANPIEREAMISLYQDVVRELIRESRGLSKESQSNKGRIGSRRVQELGLRLDEIFNHKGYDVQQYPTSSRSSPTGTTFEEYIRPLDEENIPPKHTISSSNSGPEQTSVFTDRTYYNATTKRKITVETVDIQGTIKGDGLKLATGEQTKLDVLLYRRRDTVTFAIPKMKLVTRRK